MTSTQTKAVIDDYYASLRNGDGVRLRDLLAENVEWRMPISLPNNLHVGREMVTAELIGDTVKRTFAKGSFHMLVRQIVVEGDVAVVRQHVDAVSKIGRDYHMDYCFIYTVREGRITLIEEYLDTRLAAEILELEHS